MENLDFREQRALLAELKEMQAELKHREMLLQSLNSTASLLIANETDRPMDTIRKGMQIIGKYVNIDRVHIWKRTEIDGEKQFYRDLGWESEYARKTYPIEQTLPNFPYIELNDEWEAALEEGKLINSIASDMPESIYCTLRSTGVKSILFAPVFIQGKFWGYVSYDDCRSEAPFTDKEVEILQSSSLLMVSALARSEMTEQLILAREAALLGAKAKTEFLATMSHEIRSPLNVVVGMTSIGQNATSVERKNYCFGKIDDASKHLLGVINNVLDISKIEANKLELSEVAFDFEKVLQRVVNAAAFRIEEKRQHLMVYIDNAIPEILIGDDQRLSQIFTNLLSNAVKFTPEGGHISINNKLLDFKNGLYTIRNEVKDTGIGISEEQKQNLFDSFQQASSDISRNFGGTGLGLAISKRIVELMGGSVWIESELGKGSSFIFTVKLQQANENKRKHKLIDGASPRNLRVLLIDNDRDVREYFDDIAMRFSFECNTTDSGDHALELIDNNKPFDLFFIEWKMPGIDGLMLTKLIRERAGSRSVIALMSAHDMSEVAEQAKEIGVDRFLTKPLFPSSIADLIVECVGKESLCEPAEQPPETENFNGAKILLVEDVEINREIVLELLEPMSLNIDCAENGVQAVEKFCADPLGYDLVLMDVQMPEMDGYEATRRIRAFNSGHARYIPIIAMTANVFKQDVERCFEAGMNDHIGKPVSLDSMVAMLRKYLK